MKPLHVLRTVLLAAAFTGPALISPSFAQDPPELRVIDAAEVDLEQLQWVARAVVVFADSPVDPRFAEQMRLLRERPLDMVSRDVVVITDTDPAARSALRTKLRPRGFMTVLIGKDGGVKLRKPSPWSTRELSRSIDKMPMRQREIREGRAGQG